MATYYTQDATVGREKNRFYGEMATHSHTTANAFTVKLKEVMRRLYPRTDAGDIEVSDFRSGQSKAPTGGHRQIELKFKSGAWKEA